MDISQFASKLEGSLKRIHAHFQSLELQLSKVRAQGESWNLKMLMR